MTDKTKHVRIDEIHWPGVLPWLCLFRSFRGAIRPSRLLPALLLVMLLYVMGMAIDGISGVKVLPQEVGAEATNAPPASVTGRAGETGVLEATQQFKLQAFGRLARAAASLNFGFDELITPPPPGAGQGDTVVSALRDLVIVLPRWFVREHPWLMLICAAVSLVLWSVFGGVIARQAALDAAGPGADGRDGSTHCATGFALSRFGRFFLAPLFPLICAGILAVFLLAGGFILFNLPVLDIIGGILFFGALLLGLAIVVLLLLTIAGWPMLYPAIAVDDSDIFDAVSRALGYVLGRPWRWLFYSAVALVYGAITYLFVGVVLFLTVAVAQYFVQAGVIAEVDGVNRFDLILPQPAPGRLTHDLASADLTWSGKTAAAIVWFWVTLARGLLLAYAISFFITVNTWIYLLLRRAQDGNELDDVYLGRLETDAAPTGAGGD